MAFDPVAGNGVTHPPLAHHQAQSGRQATVFTGEQQHMGTTGTIVRVIKYRLEGSRGQQAMVACKGKISHPERGLVLYI